MTIELVMVAVIYAKVAVITISISRANGLRPKLYLKVQIK
jgi:hypothetical protein